MNASEARVGGLTQVDKLGQAALDAIYAEEAQKHPEDAAIRKVLKDHEAGLLNPHEVLEQIQALTGMDMAAVTKYALESMVLGSTRERTVREYLSLRTTLTELGVI
ncbi:hypothetical protein SEA_SUCHA_39 [Microbacterium phage Sucha]|nr:hypothetical protein SEA_SUCHA_39 [Microbacterium phage Sucha]